MPFRKQFLFILSLIILNSISPTSAANHQWNLLKGIDPDPNDFIELEIGKKIVY
jgi:hypothetical protein